MRLSLVTAPATEPLTIAEVKAHLKLDSASGEPVPSVPTVALASPAVAGNVTAGAHRYCATFVTADGETSAGDLSAIVTVADAAVNGKVELTAIALGGSAVTARKLYRTTAGGSTFLLLATLSDNTTTVYTDNIADGSLGAAVPSVNTTADPELVSWITAARMFCERFTHRSLITTTWELGLDGFPYYPLSTQYQASVAANAVQLPQAPLQSVTSIIYVDTAGATQTWNSSNYTVDTPAGPTAGPGSIVPGWSVFYPVTRTVPNAVTIRFVAGYGSAGAVPAPIKSAMKLLIGLWHANREAGQIIRGSADVLPYGIESLLWPYKVFASEGC